MASGNPVLAKAPFKEAVEVPQPQRMTMGGVINKTLFLFLLLLISASWIWIQYLGQPDLGNLWIWATVGWLGGVVVAIILIFNQDQIKILAPLYSLFVGLALGSTTVWFESIYPGIAVQAAWLTLGIMLAMLLAYKFHIIKLGEKLKAGIIIATLGIFIVYLVQFIVGILGAIFGWNLRVPYIHQSGPIGIAFSIFVVIMASLNLLMDFESIDQGVKNGAPKEMEWYGAFGLTTTLIWLYVEILHLLAKLANNSD
jgi:uncharacterized YccA/Bax inhibitor family protein